MTGLKEEKLREHVECTCCGKKIGELALPIFWLFTVERHGLDMNAVSRQQGLGQYLGGHGALAMIMGPNEDMTKRLTDPVTMMVCDSCVLEKLWFVFEEVEKRENDTETDNPDLPGK